MDSGIAVAILVPMSMFAMIFGISYLDTREKLSMIERGMDPRGNNPKNPNNTNNILTGGLLLIGAGLGLFLAASLINIMPSWYDSTAIYISLIALFGGLGLFTAYSIEKREAKKEKEEQKHD
jgi:hypothetical protein